MSRQEREIRLPEFGDSGRQRNYSPDLFLSSGPNAAHWAGVLAGAALLALAGLAVNRRRDGKDRKPEEAKPLEPPKAC